MKIFISLFILALAVSLGFGEASADSATKFARKRHKMQKKRIRSGVQNGSLTAAEASSLVAGQKRVRKAKKLAASDGEISAVEKRKLNRMQNRQSRRIFKKKHNRRKRK
ncbi:MAG: hypothetical protein HN509_17970 [Halobacteriovoraceae bacterium]|jgi:hypothetical protein|nr:hypothetical protein [Halobacteriovoraceae bacterium]MBT5094962.1 hypothetical protein [Halobacteriovoraceae bacterium]